MQTLKRKGRDHQSRARTFALAEFLRARPPKENQHSQFSLSEQISLEDLAEMLDVVNLNKDV